LSPGTSRREFLKLIAGTGVASGALTQNALASSAPGAEAPLARLEDKAVRLEFDSGMRLRVSRVGTEAPLTPWQSADALLLADGTQVQDFTLQHPETPAPAGAQGRGLTLTGVATVPDVTGREAARVEKRVSVSLHPSYPGFALCRASFRNLSSQPLKLRGWRASELQFLAATAEEPQFWSYCGSTHSDRRDWVQPVKAGFAQDNFMGMTASDYGGGTPILDVWRRDCGLAVGHLETHPRLLSLPVARTAAGATLAIAAELERTLAPGEELVLPETFIAVHTRDYFATLDTYRRVMAARGVSSPHPPQAAYESIWCAWGYERECTVQLIEDTLPKVKELGLAWAVIDDGWQTNVGDWRPNPQKFPRGAADMQQLVQEIRAKGLKPRLWVAPLAAVAGSDLMHDQTDMLLLDRDGAPQAISWWNAFYLCPAYAKTVSYTDDLVRRFIGEWGFAGLKIDGQHLNGVAPCYNPAHHHARPEESVEGLQDFLHSMYAAATKLDPQVVMELCPCGTAYTIFNFASMNQAPASDPESSWQVRHKGKTLKGLIGPSAAFAGDHVELSDGGDDFASTVGIGAIVSTKFTWPKDPKPKDSFLLTPEREALWRRWISLYNEHLLPEGTYRGELYDIGFDKPETHVVEKSGRLYYAFYAKSWNGPVTLRGLPAGRYRLRDYFNARDLGEFVSPGPAAPLTFEHFLVLEAVPA
jgi:alpha-galactosidase